MTLEHQVLIKRGIKRASFHYACHRFIGQAPENDFSMHLARFLRQHGRRVL